MIQGRKKVAPASKGQKNTTSSMTEKVYRLCASACARLCVCVRAFVRLRERARVRMCACVRVCVCACTPAYVCAWAHEHVCQAAHASAGIDARYYNGSQKTIPAQLPGNTYVCGHRCPLLKRQPKNTIPAQLPGNTCLCGHRCPRLKRQPKYDSSAPAWQHMPLRASMPAIKTAAKNTTPAHLPDNRCVCGHRCPLLKRQPKHDSSAAAWQRMRLWASMPAIETAAKMHCGHPPRLQF